MEVTSVHACVANDINNNRSLPTPPVTNDVGAVGGAGVSPVCARYTVLEYFPLPPPV